jgi:hypothetical protein
LLLARFDGAKEDALLGVLHEIAKEDKGKELALGGFRSPPPMGAKDTEVSPLHVIFDSKGVLVGKEYFKINHLFPLPFNLVQGPTLLSKSIVPKLALKEFLLRCLEWFIVFIWTFVPFAKMNAYLRKIVEEMGIEIDPQRIMGRNLYKINKHFLQFPIKPGSYHIDHFIHDQLIYHKNHFDFFLRYPNIHVDNTLLVNNTPYRTCLNLPSNAIFVESYEYAPKKDNYLMKTLFPYLKFFHYFGLSVPTFVELYPFGAIRSIKEDDVRFWTLFEKCTMACSTNLYRNRLTFVVSSPNIIFCSFLPMLFWIFQFH